MTESVVNIRVMKSRGFSLLEIIIVLAFIGIILAMAAVYARKMIDEKTRQASAEAIAQEVYGVLQFVNTDSIEVFSDKDTSFKKVTNPLYQLPHMRVYPEAEDGTPDAALIGLEQNPIWLSHPYLNFDFSLIASVPTASPYIGRNFSKNMTNPISNGIEINDGGKIRYSHSLKWSQSIWPKDSVRNYFTDSGCVKSGSKVYFTQQFLSCHEHPALNNSEIAISRIDFVNNKGSSTRTSSATDISAPINRVDVYVSFKPIDGNSARLEQFITPLMNAFRAKKITPNINNIYLVMQEGIESNNAWTLLDKKTGSPAKIATSTNDLALFTDLPDMIGKLQKDHTYALRFTFDGNGDYLRTDGLNAATKICWNTSTGVAGPCLTSPSEELLVLKQRKDPKELANLQVGNVVLKGSHMAADGHVEPEYYTASQVQYAVFGENGQRIGPFYKEPIKDNNNNIIATKLCSYEDLDNCITSTVNNLQIGETNNGAISVPVQTCPIVDDFTRIGTDKNDADYKRLYPRLSVSVSSVISGIRRDRDGNIDDSVIDIFSQSGHVITNLDNSDISVNRLGGVAMQIFQCKNTNTEAPCYGENVWRIASLVATEDIKNKGKAWQFYNPPWLSVMITKWCSSEEQQE